MEEKEKKKTLKIFAAAAFFNDLGSDMIYPIWPLFVTTVLGANMAVLGFIDGFGEAIVSISQAISGYISDRIRKRKVFVWMGYLLGSASRAGYAFSSAWRHLLFFRILDRAGKIRGAPRDAIIADISSDENRGSNFGILRAMDNFGAVCGIIVCILLFKLIGYRNLFLLASVPSVIGAFLVFSKAAEEKKSDSRIYQNFSFKNLNGNFKLFLLLSSFFALGSFSYSFLLVYAKNSGFKPVFVPILYLIFNSIAFLVSVPFGKLSDKIGRKAVLFISYAFWAMVCLNFILVRSYPAIIATFVLYGLHKGSLEPSQKAFISELAPDNFRASCLGSFQMVTGLVALPASLTAGVLWEKMGMRIPFYFSLILTVAAILMLFFVSPPARKVFREQS